MKKGSNTIIPYEDIDYELVELIKCMNNIEGIETIECCCGHGVRPCQIWFVADSLKDVTHFMHNYLYRSSLWRIVIDLSDADIDKNKWDSPAYLLETTCYDYYYTGVCIDNLTYKIKMKNQNPNQNTAKWINKRFGSPVNGGSMSSLYCTCSNCYKETLFPNKVVSNYCQNCGRKMVSE